MAGWFDIFKRKSPGPKTDRFDGHELPSTDAQLVADPWNDPVIRAEIDARGQARLDDKYWVDQFVYNLDGYVNAITGLGDFTRDKVLGGQQGGPTFSISLLNGYAYENRWRGSDLGARIVETIPDEMTREGFDIQVQPSDDDADDKEDAFPGQPGGPPLGMTPAPADKPKPLEIDDESQDIAEEVEGELERLGADEVLWYALCYERTFGGGAVLIGADDGMDDLTKPLDEERIKSVDHLNTFWGGWDGEIVAWSYYRDPTKPNYGQPELYMIRNLGVPLAAVPAPGSSVAVQPVPKSNGAYGPLIYWVHESRLLLFPGVAASRRARVQMRGWGDSIFVRCDEVLSQYNQTWAGVANLMTDWSQGVLSIENLAQAMGANNKVGTRNLQNRAMAANITRSLARMMVIDTKEKFERTSAPLGGIGDVLQQFALRLAAAAGMPVSLLMGQAPAGLNATGDSEIRWFYDRVRSMQRRRILPQLRKLIRLIMKAKEGPTSGAEPGKWSIAGKPLYQMSAKEHADRYYTIAQGDQIYFNMSAVSAEEIAAKRFGGADYDDGPIALDLEGRKEMAAQDEKDKADREKQMAEAAKAAAKNPQPQGGPNVPASPPTPAPQAPVVKKPPKK